MARRLQITVIEKTVDPADVGLDADRLVRIGDHFDRYVSEGKLAGYAALVSRRGEIAYLTTSGRRDIESGAPIEEDTLYRIYSMTKPVTSVAAMMLYEAGCFDLNDPVADYLPEFERPRVFTRGSSLSPVLRPTREPIRIWHLLSHTAGLSYGFYDHPVDVLYRAAGFELGSPAGADLAKCCEIWAGLPLLFDPGSSWNYSHATDVVGRLVEVLSGKQLDEFLAERVLRPLQMEDTGFFVPESEQERLATLYVPDAMTMRASPSGRLGPAGTHLPTMLSGGAGLISSVGDYYRFTRMLLAGGELDGVRLLGPRTLAYMTRNHLPGGADIASFGTPVPGESSEGVGFGLGFSVVVDPAAMKVPASEGEFAWGGAASTVFFVDPAEELIVLFMTQLLPSSTYPIRRELHRLVYQSVID